MVLQQKNRSTYLQFLLGIFVLLSSLNSNADDDISLIFKKHNVTGTLIVESIDTKTRYVYNQKRSTKRYFPASTFKIPNTLIALKEKVVNHSTDVIKWDKKQRDFKVWNQDQTLATAFSRSCVWCYQEFASKIGEQTYQNYVNEMNYGNKKIGNNITTFWLVGDLAISATSKLIFYINFMNALFLSHNITLIRYNTS